uniref:Uncharacterized protein n=1 Tax=Panagrolaimus davidi TaxID=227884 RepID=A0A914PK76_9BILA
MMLKMINLRRPVVINRTGSQIGDKKYAELAAELAKSQEEPLQDPNLLSVYPQRFNGNSDPCIVTKINESPDLEESHPSGSAPKDQKPPLCPTIRINSDSSISENVDDPPKRKRRKSRHVQICIPPTPDYKKEANKTTFDFSSSSDEQH